MIEHPYDKGIKKYLSGTDANLDIANFEDSCLLAANDVRELISDAMYKKIVAVKTTVPTESPEKWTKSLEYLRYAMAPLVVLHQFIWLQLRISNNAITTYKSNDETTAFKYQTDEAKESLLLRHGAFLKELIDFLEAEKTIFTDWSASEQRATLQASLIKSFREFDKYYNTSGDAAFFIRSAIIRKEIQDEDLQSFVGSFADLDAVSQNKLKRALAYLTVSRACIEWDYYFLPMPLKRTINNEYSLKNGKEIEIVKKEISGKYKSLAASILETISIQKEADKQELETPEEEIKITSYKPSASDKHYFM